MTFMIQAGGRSVFFGGDSLRVAELDEIPARFGKIDLTILPTNGLRAVEHEPEIADTPGRLAAEFSRDGSTATVPATGTDGGAGLESYPT